MTFLKSIWTSRKMYIETVYGMVSDFQPQNGLFWPLSWPQMTSRYPSRTSGEHFPSIHMHIMCIWPCLRFFNPKWPWSKTVKTLVDLGWPRDAYYWFQRKNPSRMVCIPCAFGRISDFRPQMTFFDPVRWPRMTSRCTSLNSGENFQSNGMYIMCIWPYFRFSTPNDLFWPRKMTSDDLEMHTIGFRKKFPIEWYAYHVHLAIFPIFDPKMTLFDP